MSRVAAVGTYLPAWADGDRRLMGPDEDSATMAVAAASAIVRDRAGAVRRVILICRDPETVDTTVLPAVIRALGLPDDVSGELRVGGAPVTLDALREADAGSLVIAADPADWPSAAAALVDTTGLELSRGQVMQHSLPVRVRWSGSPAAVDYGDARVERELGWRPVVARLGADSEAPFLVGIPQTAVKRLGGEPLADVGGAAPAPIFALARMAERTRSGRLVAVDSGAGCGVDVSRVGEVRVAHEIRPAVPAGSRPAGTEEAVIPVSMPAYDRAFQVKVGFTAGRCTVCGVESYPPRYSCPGCGQLGVTERFQLPRTGEVYSVVTVHTPIPGVATPRGLALVSLHGVTVRVLAHVTDVDPADCQIGDSGRLVFRLIAVREGVPDYGYAFQPDVSSAERVEASA